MTDPVPVPQRPTRRWYRRIALTAITLIGVAGSLVYWRLRAPMPDVSGTVNVEGLHRPVQIIRDIDNVPHIRAENEADALFALGYVHAQERLWQMEFQRRVAWGRLSEFAGAKTVETDRFMRTIGIGRSATETWLRLDPESRVSIEAYVAGINAFLAGHRGGSLPVEFALLRLSPEPFRGEDVVAWNKVMAWMLSTNWGDELLRQRIDIQIGETAADELMPAYTLRGPIVLPADASAVPEPAEPVPGMPVAPGSPRPAGPAGTLPDVPSRVPTTRSDSTVTDLAAITHRLVSPLFAPPVGGGSNNWVVAGARTVTGKPLLANDPHLAGGLPGIWFLAHVTGGRFDAIGATMPGTPGVVIGRNARIAWGVTALLADVQDLFIEHINTSDQAEFSGAWEPMRVIREVIRVRGEADVPLRVRITRHGPLISDVIERPSTALALRWTGHDTDDQTAGASLRINRAGNWNEFVAALSRTHGPILNFVYADVDGNIGYIGPGAFPVRAHGDGRRPVPGWSGDHEWRGYIHESEWPRAFNPGRGVIVSANNKAVPDSFPFSLGTSWEAPYRAARITDMLDATTKLSVDDFGRIQRDVRTAQAAVVLPFLLKARPLDSQSREAMERLRKWDGTMSPESPSAALYDAWYTAAVRGMFEDDLGAALFADYWKTRNLSAKALDTLIRQGETTWCDDVRTPQPETCATLMGVTLQQALAEMSDRQGSHDVAKWRWDRVNRAEFPHAPFDAVPLLRWAFSHRVPMGGNAFTITPVMPLQGRVFISSYRQIIDLAELDASRFVIPGGQSGHVWSPRYDDWFVKWSQVEYVPMRFSSEAVDAAQASRLVLQPG